MSVVTIRCGIDGCQDVLKTEQRTLKRMIQKHRKEKHPDYKPPTRTPGDRAEEMYRMEHWR